MEGGHTRAIYSCHVITRLSEKLYVKVMAVLLFVVCLFILRPFYRFVYKAGWVYMFVLVNQKKHANSIKALQNSKDLS